MSLPVQTVAYFLLVTLASGELPPAQSMPDRAACIRAVPIEAQRQPKGSVIVCIEFPSTAILAVARN